MDNEQDSWGLSKGTFLEGADVTITDSTFVVDNEYAAGAVVLSLTLLPDPATWEGDTSNLRPQLYSCGGGWEIVDKGQTLQHQSGKFRNFSEMSAYGDWISHALDCEGAETYLRGAGSPHDANIWIGTRWTLGTHEYEKVGDRTKKNEEKKKGQRLVPVAFLGAEEKEATKPAKASGPVKKAGTPTPRAASKAETNGTKSGLDEEIDTKFAEMAKEIDNHDEFMNAAFDYAEENGLAGDKAVEKAIMNARQYAAWRVA